MRFLPTLRFFLVTIAVFLSPFTKADIYAKKGYENGQDGILLLTEVCPNDATTQLKMAFSRVGKSMRQGCYVINNRGNPVVKWGDGIIEELNGEQFSPSTKSVAKESNLVTVIVRDGTLATLDQVIENGVVDTIQITNEKPDTKFCGVFSPANKVVFTFTSVSKKTYPYAEGCWRKSDDGTVSISGVNFSSKKKFSFKKESVEFSRTDLGRNW
ncbi:hypothetical protein [Dickeya dianthicola]|uniref:hypothetical protein n=1 Tax=Dickeya dianthicola TaxID=204039 RepID=UPI00301A7C91